MAQKRTRAELRRHGVVINGSIASVTSTDVPSRVRNTIGVLLEFTDSIHISWQERGYFQSNLNVLSDGHLQEGIHCLTPPVTAYFGENHPAGSKHSERETRIVLANEEIHECIAMAEGFKKHERQLEDDLTDRYRFAVFRSPDQLYRGYAEKSKITWTLHRDVPWTEAFPCFQSGSTGISGSRPDVFYGLRVVRSSEDDLLMGKDSTHFDNLTIDILGKLRSKGVPSTITKALLHKYDEDLSKMTESLCASDSHHLTCFPFAIVELKKENVRDSEVEVCECQAASASVRALSLYKLVYEKGLWMHSRQSPQRSSHQLPPVVAFTCVGSKVRVWLTYLGRDAKTFNMRCIYSTDLVLAWGVLSLRRIVKNMLTWQENIVARYLQPALDSLRDMYDIERRDTIYESDDTIQTDIQHVPALDRVLSRSPEAVETSAHDAGTPTVSRRQPSSASVRPETPPQAPPSSASAQSTTPKAHWKAPQAQPTTPQAHLKFSQAQSTKPQAFPMFLQAQPSTTQHTEKKSEKQHKTANSIFRPSPDSSSTQGYSFPSHIKMPPREKTIFSTVSGVSTSPKSNSDPFPVSLPQLPAVSSAVPKDIRAESTTAKPSRLGHRSLYQESSGVHLPRGDTSPRDYISKHKPASKSKYNTTVEDDDPDAL